MLVMVADGVCINEMEKSDTIVSPGGIAWKRDQLAASSACLDYIQVVFDRDGLIHALEDGLNNIGYTARVHECLTELEKWFKRGGPAADLKGTDVFRVVNTVVTRCAAPRGPRGAAKVVEGAIADHAVRAPPVADHSRKSRSPPPRGCNRGVSEQHQHDQPQTSASSQYQPQPQQCQPQVWQTPSTVWSPTQAVQANLSWPPPQQPGWWQTHPQQPAPQPYSTLYETSPQQQQTLLDSLGVPLCRQDFHLEVPPSQWIGNKSATQASGGASSSWPVRFQ